MLALTHRALRRPWPRWSRATARRALIAGTAWGTVFTAGFTAYAWSFCGGVCLDDVLVTAATSVAAGIGVIGPLAAFGSVDA
jgi:hypothetical protein